MPFGLPVALLLAAQAPAAEPAAQAPPAAANVAPGDACDRAAPDRDPREIVVCAERPQGYRIDPDILTAKKMKRSGARPTRPGPGGTPRDTTACVVGPQGCPSAGINMLAAAMTAAEMARRLLKGEEIGSMFVTDPTPSEYQLYLAAKREREAREAAKAARARKAN